MHTYKYLNFDSHLPILHKKTVEKTLLMRAHFIPNINKPKQKEAKSLINALMENYRSKEFLEKPM